jgi:hypothetical protein
MVRFISLDAADRTFVARDFANWAIFRPSPAVYRKVNSPGGSGGCETGGEPR